MNYNKTKVWKSVEIRLLSTYLIKIHSNDLNLAIFPITCDWNEPPCLFFAAVNTNEKKI